MKNFLANIAAEENCELISRDEKISLGKGAYMVETTHQFAFNYKQSEILVICSFGAHAMATIFTRLQKQSHRATFSITTRSHFSTLFSRNKNRIRINSEDSNLTHVIKENPSIKTLTEICRHAEFEPFITGKNEENNYIIRTTFQLIFPERESVMKPLIQFYKDMIDQSG